jgi:GTP-binding protein
MGADSILAGARGANLAAAGREAGDRLAAVFEKSVVELDDLPAALGPEVAFAGRSNSGKSSAINALTGVHRLAYTSKTPGRTQAINYFRVGEHAHLVDLPGYGYARVDAATRERWQRTLGDYLRGRASLAGVVLIMDIRHPLTELDRTMLHWLAPRRCPVLVLLSKADKLSAVQRRRQHEATTVALHREAPAASALVFSALRGIGIAQATAIVRSWLALDPSPAAGPVAHPRPRAHEKNPRPREVEPGVKKP